MTVLWDAGQLGVHMRRQLAVNSSYIRHGSLTSPLAHHVNQ
jgi:hypothetical protein